MPKSGMRHRQNTNTKVLEAIAQRIRNDIVASIGPQEGICGYLLSRIVGVRPGQERITHDPSASTSQTALLGTEKLSVLSMNSDSGAV